MAQVHLYGTSVSPGIALGTIHFLHDEQIAEMRSIRPEEIPLEQARLLEAAQRVRLSLVRAQQKVPDDLAEYRDVIAAQIELSQDPKLLDNASRRIAKEAICAASAMRKAIAQLSELFRNMDDPYLQDRAQDIRAVGTRICEALSGEKKQDKKSKVENIILAAEDISPADIMDMDLSHVRGLVTREGGATSHSAILARGLHIPALVNVTGVVENAREGDAIILDGLGGNVLIRPNEKDSDEYQARETEYKDWESKVKQMSHWPADTRDGLRVRVFANVDRVEETEELKAFGADGIGLYRTEFSFLRSRLPDEEELVKEYTSIVRNSPGNTIFRTLDAGADKLLKAQEAIREPNPALGLRGIRYTLRYQETFRRQLRALLRAGTAGRISLLLPMITMVEEVRAVRRILQEVEQELSARAVPHIPRVPIGVMIETPAAVLIADALAKESDFFSIGSNDLVHYLMAIDRNNRHVAYLNDAIHPSVVRALKRIIDSGHREGISVSSCGELSSDPFGIVLMLGMGLDSFSASPSFLPGIKHLIRKLDSQACTRLSEQVLMSTDIPACKHMISEMLQQVFGRELAFHTSTVVKA